MRPVQDKVVPHLTNLMKKQQDCRQERAKGCVFYFEVINCSTVISLQQNAQPGAAFGTETETHGIQ